MVLETILTVEAIKKHPILMLLDTLIIATISLWVSYFVFPGSASILNIAFVSLALVPLIQKMFYVEETEEVSHPGRSVGFLSRHGQMLKIYAWFFIGLTLSYSFWYFFLPVTMEKSCVFGSVCFNIPTRDSVFKEQEATLSDIGSLSKSLTTGNATLNSSNNIDFFKIFEIIFSNNLTVLFLAILFSFVYGAGSLFLIGWNASVVAVKIGQFAHQILPMVGDGIFSYPVAYGLGLLNGLGFLPHGIFEITGFFVGSVAGGIISIAITKKQTKSHEFSIIAKDSLTLILMAIALIFIGAVIESYLITFS